MQYIKRNNLHAQWVELWEALTDTMDKALERSWVAVQAAKLSTSMWLESHEDYIDLVIHKESLTKCVRNTTTWSDVQEDLVEVCKTQCGRRIFSSKLGELTGAACSKQIADVINKMKDMARTTQAAIDGLVRRMEEMAKNLGKDLHAMGSDTEISYLYCGFDCKTKVSTMFQEAMVKIHANLRSFALRDGTLPVLWCEKELIEPLPLGTKLPKVDVALVAGSKRARAACKEMLEHGNGQDIKLHLAKHHTLLKGFDKYWQIERDFWLSVVGQPGETRLKSAVLNELPTVDADVNASDALRAIEGIEKSKLYEFVGIGCQIQVSEVTKVVRTIACNRAPSWPNSNNEFLAAARSRINACCRVSVPFASGAPDVKIGMEAMKALLTKAEETKANRALALSDIRPFRAFPWLLEPVAQKKSMLGWPS